MSVHTSSSAFPEKEGGDPERRPRLLEGATVHGPRGIRQLRHRAELPLLRCAIAVSAAVAVLSIVFAGWLVAVPEVTGFADTFRNFVIDDAAEYIFFGLLAPVSIWVARALMYARMRATAVQMSPTQFPEGYRMVVEAAEHFGMRRVPDAYVVLGDGTINAFAAGHGYRRFVAVHSDLFEIGGAARDREALRFIIAHEVGHLAAGHTSFWRLAVMSLPSLIPVFGPALTRAQEYTADNHGFEVAPQGAPGTMGVLTGGKYLGAQVNFHALADRAAREGGLWLHVVAWMASHPIITWRAHALRDRSRPGRIMIKPPASTAWFPPSAPNGSDRSRVWPSPAQVLAHMDGVTVRVVGAEEQFGRYPGVEYPVSREILRLADPTPVPRSEANADGPKI